MKKLFLVVLSCLVLLSLVPVVSAEPILQVVPRRKVNRSHRGNPVHFSGSPFLGIVF
jgi:hypothetical protein